MILESIATWRSSISSISVEGESNITDLQPIDLDAKFREEEAWLGIG